MKKKEPKPVDRHVGARVRMRRMMLGKSQSDLGDALGLTFQQIQKYEKGANRIGASRLQDIANYLQVQVQWFYAEQPVKGAAQAQDQVHDYTSGFLATSDGLSICKSFMGLKDPKVRRAFVALIQATEAAQQ